jgi:putative NADH-flavin reductase
MKIVLLGANGRTGRQLLARALAAGDQVTALVRVEGRLADVTHPNLCVEVGSPCDPGALASLLPGHDVVISTLGPRWPTQRAAAIYPDSARALVEAMPGSGVHRLLMTSSALLFPPSGWSVRALRGLVPRVVDGARQMEDQVRASALDWTIARTSFLNDGDDPTFRLGENALPADGGAVSRAAVARFLLEEAQWSEHRRSVVGLCG